VVSRPPPIRPIAPPAMLIAAYTRSARVRGGPSGKVVVSLPAWTADPTVAWRAENPAIGSSDGTVALVPFVAKTLAGSTLVSREIIEDSNLSGLLESAYGKALALAFDKAALVGSGVDPEPPGLTNVTGMDKSDPGHKVICQDLINAAAAIRGRYEQPNAVIMDPATMAVLGGICGTDGHYVEWPPYLANVAPYESGQGGANTFYMGLLPACAGGPHRVRLPSRAAAGT
jgi:HK97 family phage major capsid protein